MTRFGQITLFASLILMLLCGIAESQTAPTAQQLVDQGQVLERAKQYDKAVEVFREAIKVDPNLGAAHLGIGSVLNNMGRAGEAVEELKIATVLDPKNTIGHINLGITLMNLNRLDEAVVELNEAKQLAPNNASIYQYLGNAMITTSRFEEALTYYKRSLELYPNSAANYANIGLVYMRQGKYGDAIEPFKTALRLEPGHKGARYHLSNAYGFTGKYKDAIDSWTKYLELLPNAPDGLSGRALNYLYEGNYGREAATDAQKFVGLYGWRTGSSPYRGMIAIIGYRLVGMEPEAQAIIGQGLKKADPDTWVYQIIRFFGGQISADELLGLAANNDQKTEAHAYIGMDLRTKGKADEAKVHFQWVRDFGNKRFVEYPLAVAELGRMSN